MPEGSSHLDLLALSAEIGDAARSEDLNGLHAALCRLRNGLAAHIAMEAEAVAAMRGAADTVRNGQRRLVRLVDAMLAADDDGDGRCACIVRAAELRAGLVRQVRIEDSLGSRLEVRS